MNYTVTIDQHSYQLSIREAGEGLEISLDGKVLHADMVPVAPEVYSLLIDGRSYEVQVRGHEDGYQVFFGPRHYTVRVENERARMIRKLSAGARAHERSREIKAAMPGLVVKVEVKEGDGVKPGDGLVVVEAMKMENEVRAQQKGVVKQLFVTQGMTVDQGQTLLILE
jgi:biotin carboxyl carrier protein